jgi:glycosyltransferase involved in cell wall biosynthesis
MYATRTIWSQLNSSDQRHICIVSETYPPEVNGVAMTLAHLVEGLRVQGHTVSVVRPRQQPLDSASGRGDPQVTVVPSLPIPGYKGVHVGLPAPGLLQGCWTLHRPDVVYVATEGPLGWSAVHTAKRLRIPVFSGFHTNFHSYARHYRLGWLQPLIFHYLCRFHHRTSGTLVPSVELRDHLQAVGLHNVSVLGRGVDTQLFTPARRCAALRRMWGVSESDLAVLYVGRIAPEKNLELAVAAYRAMQRCSASVQCIVIGDGPLRAALQKAHPDLIFCGIQTGGQLARHYASADVFLFPSETETFGNVTLEAMASGLVVVAYNYAAAHMHITHGKTGVLVPYGASQAFVDAAVQLARAPQSLDTLRQHARAYAASLDWQCVVERFVTLLTGALGESHTAPASALTYY